MYGGIFYQPISLIHQDNLFGSIKTIAYSNSQVLLVKNIIIPYSGPYLTPSVHQQIELLTITSQIDYDVVSDGHYDGDDYADSQADQSFSNDFSNMAGSSNVQPKATITKDDLIANYFKDMRKLNTKKEKFSSYDSW